MTGRSSRSCTTLERARSPSLRAALKAQPCLSQDCSLHKKTCASAAWHALRAAWYGLPSEFALTRRHILTFIRRYKLLFTRHDNSTEFTAAMLHYFGTNMGGQQLRSSDLLLHHLPLTFLLISVRAVFVIPRGCTIDRMLTWNTRR